MRCLARMAAVAASLAITVGDAKADTYQTYDLSGSYTSITGYSYSDDHFSEGTLAFSGEVTYDLTTQTFSEFTFGDEVSVFSDGANYAAEYIWVGEPPEGFDYPPGSTIGGIPFEDAACGANPLNCIGLVVNEDIVQTEVTPLPAALPLFTAGLGVLGLFGWRRTRTT